MIPGSYEPIDRPRSTQEMTRDDPDVRVRRSARSAWITLGVVILAIAALIFLLSLIPDTASVTVTTVQPSAPLT
jgi:uncharacterized membrane protein